MTKFVGESLVVADLTRASKTCPSTGESGARTNWVMEEMVKGYHYAE